MTAEEANNFTADELQSVKEAVDIGTALRYYWFRGHRKLFRELLPSAQREQFFSTSENIEFKAAQRFRLRAQAYRNEVPAWDDHVSWLFLAQHYSVPTRLLDWTKNVLVGLYFAVTGTREEQEEGGELWCIDPGKLNWHSADCHICFPDSGFVRYMAAPVFLEPDQFARFIVTLGVPFQTLPPAGPLALIPPMQFPRMAPQMSRFTIHLSREPGEQIESRLRGSELVRYIIPAAFKAILARDLSRLGFTHENLYRDLESLGRSIKEEIVEPDYEVTVPRFYRTVNRDAAEKLGYRAEKTKDVPLPENEQQ